MTSEQPRARKLKLLVGLFVLCCAPFRAANCGEPPYVICDTPDLPLLATDAKPRFEVLHDGFLTGTHGESAGSFILRNIGDRPIRALSIAMQYVDRDGKTLIVIPFVAVTGQAGRSFDAIIHTQYVEPLETPIYPGETKRIQGLSYTVVGECPASARLEFVSLQFSDGSSYTWSSEGWEIGPVPQYLPAASLRLDPSLVRAPVKFLARVQVSSGGRISQFSAPSEVAKGLVDELRKQSAEWFFFPASRDGKPVASELSLLFDVVPSGANADEPLAGEIRSPLVIIRLLQRETGADTWMLWYGRRSGATKIE
jgi:hypothetical protein